MSDGAFRDTSAALERAAMLEQENEQLRTELADLGELRIQVEELDKLRAEIEELRGVARGENEGAYLKRLGEERDELAAEVKTLRERLATQERELAKLRWKAKTPNVDFESALEKLVNLFRPKK